MNDRNDIIIEAWNTVLFDKFVRFKHLLINGLSGHVGLLDSLMRFIARDLIFLTPLLLLALWFWPAGTASERAFNQRLAAATALGCVFAIALAAVVGELHEQARPFVADLGTRQLIPHAADNGFPSDHTSFAVAVGGAIVWWKRRLGSGYLMLGLIEGFSRVYVGLHWPSDVLAGVAVGLVAGGLAACTVPLWSAPLGWASRVLPPLLVSRPNGQP